MEVEENKPRVVVRTEPEVEENEPREVVKIEHGVEESGLLLLVVDGLGCGREIYWKGQV